MSQHERHRHRRPGAVYVVHLHPVGDGYRASVREASGDALDAHVAGARGGGEGTAATAPAAILAALIAARIPTMSAAARPPARGTRPSRNPARPRTRRDGKRPC